MRPLRKRSVPLSGCRGCGTFGRGQAMAAGSELCPAELALAGRATASWFFFFFLDLVCLKRNVCLPSSGPACRAACWHPKRRTGVQKKARNHARIGCPSAGSYGVIISLLGLFRMLARHGMAGCRAGPSCHALPSMDL